MSFEARITYYGCLLLILLHQMFQHIYTRKNLRILYAKRKEWKPHSKGIAICTIAYARPSESEGYSLQLLLTKVWGPTSSKIYLQ